MQKAVMHRKYLLTGTDHKQCNNKPRTEILVLNDNKYNVKKPREKTPQTNEENKGNYV
jgi:hypothetical protein